MDQLQATYSSNGCSFFIVATLSFKFTEFYYSFLDGSKKTIVGPQNGMPCVVQYAENWCRGKITKIMNMQKVEVRLVDFGITVYIDKTLLKEMEKEFVHPPPQAHHCSLEGVASTWALQPSTKFQQVTSRDKTLIATFTRRGNNRKYSVILSERRNGSDVVINNFFIPTRRPTTSNSCGVSNVAKKNPPQTTQVNVFLLCIILLLLYTKQSILIGNNWPTHLKFGNNQWTNCTNWESEFPASSSVETSMSTTHLKKCGGPTLSDCVHSG